MGSRPHYAYSHVSRLVGCWFLFVTIPNALLNTIETLDQNYDSSCDELWPKLSSYEEESNESAIEFRLCEVDGVSVRSDRRPVVDEDCQPPSICVNGTFVINLSVLPARASSLLAFSPTPFGRTQLGEYDLTESGRLDFRPLSDKHGSTAIDIRLTDKTTNCSRVCTFQLNVRPQPDPPKIFVLNNELQLVGRVQSTSLSSPQNETISDWLTVEQNTRTNAAYRDLEFAFGAFDADFENVRYLSARLITQPRFGKLFIVRSDELQVSDELHQSDGCQSKQTLEALDDFSCLPRSVLRDGYANYKWMFTILRYQPHEMYSGPDWFEIAVEKSSRLLGSRFFHTRVIIAVLENLCQNNGTCVGHPLHNKDLDCKSPIRMTGFYRLHYRCNCPVGWVGSYCENQRSFSSNAPVTNESSVSESSTLPATSETAGTTVDAESETDADAEAAALSDATCQCEAPFVCSNGKCQCPDNDQDCEQPIKPWQTAMIVVFGGVIVVCVTIAIILYSQKGYPNFK